MVGKVKMYNEEKGYGFIVGEDGLDYFVHASAVSSTEPLYRGANVKFYPGENERGRIARQVLITQAEKRPIFIQFGDVRIKLNNIKNYGIDICNSYYYKIYEYDPQLAQKMAEEAKKERGLSKILSAFFPNSDSGSYKWNGEKIYIASFSKENALKEAGIDSSDYHRCYRRNQNGSLESCTYDDFLETQENYLYVTTYQGDNFQFIESTANFNIFDKCKEIDSYML